MSCLRHFLLYVSILSQTSHVHAYFELYHTDRTSNVHFYDCLHYNSLDNITVYKGNDFKPSYQVIPYCIRPLEQEKEMVFGSVASELTFEQLRKNNVTAQELITWSAPVDLVERYQNYLENPSLFSSQRDTFFNCTDQWFGSLCQYTFGSSQSFNEIVVSIFRRKKRSESGKLATSFNNLTYYTHVKCDRGPDAIFSLDWREVCDGKVDCFLSGIDERDCFELERNECGAQEFRCHNGMQCIPDVFIGDDPYNPDCLDSTDEVVFEVDAYRHLAFTQCYHDPAFRCEEADHPINGLHFVCGDGQRSEERLPEYRGDYTLTSCANCRDEVLGLQSLFLYNEHSSSLTYDCWFLMYCITGVRVDVDCRALCPDWSNNCELEIGSRCSSENYVIFPTRPVFEQHFRFVYLTNRTIGARQHREPLPLPDYICYEPLRCSFHVPTFTLNGLICSHTEDLSIRSFYDIFRLSRTCSSVGVVRNNSHCSDSSLFRCPNTSKCISKYRLFDGQVDCYQKTDEEYIDFCESSNLHRFKCTSERKCISRILLRNGNDDCLVGEDEKKTTETSFSFTTICNGYTHLPPQMIDGLNETDETNCQHWPCNNLYTRCDSAWNCPTGIDELNCVGTEHNCHTCVSPYTLKTICLPVERAANKIVDCLGAPDEREHCRLQHPNNFYYTYRCWNDTKCIGSTDVCNIKSVCPFEELAGKCSEEMRAILLHQISDENLKYIQHAFFMIQRSFVVVEKQDRKKASESLLSVLSQENPSFRESWVCNRGILIYVGLSKSEHCLCPPSYYGGQCQFQSQRVSLSVQFRRQCAPNCRGVFGIITSLVDSDQVIYSQNQIIYVPTRDCDKKFNMYFLYGSRSKNVTKNFSLHIDMFNKTSLTHHTSVILPVQFNFLPVNRISVRVTIPAVSIRSYNANQSFACNCSSDALCFRNSTCLCSLRKRGPRCFLPSACQSDPCKNGALCIPGNEKLFEDKFTCLCPDGYSGVTCEVRNTRIDIAFEQLIIPQSLLTHFIAVRDHNDPVRTTLYSKISFDREMAIVYISTPFQLVFGQIHQEYYLAYVQVNHTPSARLALQLTPSKRCPHIRELLKQAHHPLLRRVKFYHMPCLERSALTCLHDGDQFMCLCTADRQANCFGFNFNMTYNCLGSNDCDNGAECFQDRVCPNSIMCVCPECFYGGKCQFTTKGFGLSLDTILGYQIRKFVFISNQPTSVKVSIALTTLMLVVGLLSGILSTMTFQRKTTRDVGCGFYLLASSINCLLTVTVFTYKFIWLVVSQMSLVTDRFTLSVNCVLIDFFLRCLPTIGDWLNASVAIERAVNITKGINFNKKRSQKTAKWVTLIIILFTIASVIHDPIHRKLIDDVDEERTWCLVKYSHTFEIYNSVVNIVHFIVPFSINFICALVIIITGARRRTTAKKDQTYKEHFQKQFRQHKHLLISPVILVLLGVPRLIISFLSGCMKSVREPWLFLSGYFVSFVPPLLTFVVFVLPSEMYMREFILSLKPYKRTATF